MAMAEQQWGPQMSWNSASGTIFERFEPILWTFRYLLTVFSL